MTNRLPWLLLAGLGGYSLLRRLGTRSGATDEEFHRALPGDEIIPHPMFETTHAIDIDAPPSVVWKWLIQAGFRPSGRAGWYTDSWIDPFLERVVFPLTVPADKLPAGEWKHSSEALLPEFHHTAVGDVVPDGPPGSAYFTVRAVDPERAWVLYSDSHLRYMSPSFLHGTSMASYGEFTWVFVLRPIGERGTRLILRTRGSYGPPLIRRMSLPLVYAGEAIFPRLLLRGIRRRAEATAAG